MDERYLPGMQVDAPAGVRARRPVFQVALDMAPNRGELGPYLVVAAGFKLDFQQMVPLEAEEELVPEARFPRLTALTFHDIRLVLGGISFQPVHQGT